MANPEEPSYKDFNNFVDKVFKKETITPKSYKDIFESGLTPVGRKLFNIASINEKVVENLLKYKDLPQKETETFVGKDLSDPATPEELAQRIRILQEENSALKKKNYDLDISKKKLIIELLDTNRDLTDAQDRIKDLEADHIIFKNLNQMLVDKIAQMQESNKRAQRPDASDPRGFYKVLGIDPTLAASLTQDAFDALLTSLYRAYSRVHHPDLGGDTERMKLVNNAYEFLKNPLNRRTYGRS